MKKSFIFVSSLCFLIALVSILGSLMFYDGKQDDIIKNEYEENNKTKQIIYEKVNLDSPTINIYNHIEGKTQKMDIEQYLYGVLSSEMPSTFNEQALKAQALAARTYVIYKLENNITAGHSGATVCTDSTHCQAYKSYEDLKQAKGNEWIKNDYLKIKKAVDDTKGQIIVYEDRPILPLYFSTSSGKTENSEDVFTTQYPYLVSVDSENETQSPRYLNTYSLTNNQFIKYIKSKYPQINISQENLDDQIKILDRTQSGSVKNIEVGNIKISGIDMRKTLNLNSTNFTIECEDNKVNFTTKGYGHGVGMSQWGAQTMSQNGYNYDDIIFHYYTGVNIKDIY